MERNDASFRSCQGTADKRGNEIGPTSLNDLGTIAAIVEDHEKWFAVASAGCREEDYDISVSVKSR